MRAVASALLLALAACQRQFDPAELGGPRFDGAAEATTPAALQKHGERISWVLGCRGCHGQNLQGQLWDDNPKEYGVMWASNLTRAVPAMSDAELRTLLTRGVHPKRRELWVMPSEIFQNLSRRDVDALIAHLRSLPPTGDLSPPPRPGPRALREIASGLAKPADELVREKRGVLPLDLGPEHKLGRYITTVACTECHGDRLEGQKSEEGSTPDLVIAAAYSRDEFERLTTRGEAKGGRRIASLMQSVGRNRLSRLTPRERDALYVYLRARAEQPQ